MTVRTEREKMLAGEPYLASDPELTRARVRTRRLMARFNASDPAAMEVRAALLGELLGRVGPGVEVEPPFFCEYGSEIELGDGVFVNFNCVFLDPAPIRIGARTMIGPGVQLLTADHPRDAAERCAGPELARPITVGARVWIGGGAILCPGVSVGDDSVIGAGSVVTRDVPAGVVAAGNPCRVVRVLGGGG